MSNKNQNTFLLGDQMSNFSVPAPPRPPSCLCRLSAIATPTLQRHSHSNGGSNPHIRPCLSQQNSTFGMHSQESFAGYDRSYDGLRTDDVESSHPSLLERDLQSNPGLRRSGIDANLIRQHFYPDGGWGWIVCGVAFLAHVMTTGFQLSYGFLLLYAIKHLGQDMAMETGWIGGGSWAISSSSAIFIFALCKRKSTRLMAVIGGLVLALGILFASFAKLYHEVSLSFVIIGIGASFVRESSTLMIESYFERRRMFVEMVVMTGEGVGISLFSVIIKEGLGKLGWRYGLQVVTILMILTFFMGMFYRPATQYHPHRTAILHIKSQRKKMKVKKTHIQTPKPPFIDLAPLKSPTVRMLCLISAIGGIGIYTPVFFLSLHGHQAGCDNQDLVLLQTLLGLSLAIGVIIFSSLLINKECQIKSRKLVISHQHICQGCVILVSISILILSTLPPNFHTLCIFTFFYGLGLGGFRFSIKMLTLERVQIKHFSNVWGFMKLGESIPILISIPLIGFLNDELGGNGRMGYFVCTTATSITAVLMFFIGFADIITRNGSKYSNVKGVIQYDVSSDNRSSFRFNSSSNYGYTSVSNDYSSTTYNAPHSHSHHYPPEVKPSQYTNEPKIVNLNDHTLLHNGGCGKLQKSLSFWFQSPDIYNNYHNCPSMSKKNTNSPGSLEKARPRCIHHAHHGHQTDVSSNLQVSRSRSVPDIVAHVSNTCQMNGYHTQMRPTVQFVKQLTTKV